MQYSVIPRIYCTQTRRMHLHIWHMGVFMTWKASIFLSDCHRDAFTRPNKPIIDTFRHKHNGFVSISKEKVRLVCQLMYSFQPYYCSIIVLFPSFTYHSWHYEGLRRTYSRRQLKASVSCLNILLLCIEVRYGTMVLEEAIGPGYIVSI